MKLRNNLYLLAIVIILMGCQSSLMSLRADSSVRYGLSFAQLGDAKKNVLSALEREFGGLAHCENWQTGLGQSRRSFLLQKCRLISDNERELEGDLWGERVHTVQVLFLESQLVDLRIDVLHDEPLSLYQRHGDQVLRLFGQPENVSFSRVYWQNGRDEVELHDLKNGIIRLAVSSKNTLKKMHHTGPLQSTSFKPE